LKKRSKKLLSISGGAGAPRVAAGPWATGRGFLLLFFKKEDLPSFILEDKHTCVA
jgi:hypothetical protein